jgi:CSLREA domain-containing protein
MSTPPRPLVFGTGFVRLRRLLDVQSRRRILKRRLMLESLENRRVLANIEVTSLADVNDSNDGVITLREALTTANGTTGVADTINFADGLHGKIRLTASLGELRITDSVEIIGHGATNTIIDAGQQGFRVISISGDSTNVTISGMTITGGQAVKSDGGGIHFGAIDGMLILNNMIISGNSAISGGGLVNYGTATLNNGTLSDNSASNSGGGLFNNGTATLNNSNLFGNSAELGGGLENDGTATLNNSNISRNTASSGGGLGNHGNIDSNLMLTLNNCTLTGNSAESGGGLSSFGSSTTLTLNNTTLSENSATFGGGLIDTLGTVTLNNSTLSENSADKTGGGMYIIDSTATLNNSTIYGNYAGSLGGGLMIDGTATLNNSIVAGNTASNRGDIFGSVSGKSNLIGDPDSAGNLVHDMDGNILGDGNGNALDISTVLAPLAFNGGLTQTHALVPGSPAIDAGDNTLVDPGQTSDQRGAPFDRIDSGGTVDIGAYEYESQLLNAGFFMVTTLTDELDYSNSTVSLREAINSANGSAGTETITFAQSLFAGGSGSIVLTMGELKIASSVTVTGPGQQVLTIDANKQSRVLNVIGGTQIDVTLEGLTLTGGHTSADNRFIDGGLEDTHSGGGIRFDSSGILTLIGSTITGNSTAGDRASGGGIYTYSGAVTLTGSTVSGNNTEAVFASGGGIATYSGAVTLSGSTVSANSTAGNSASGGGICAYSGAVTLTGSTVSRNSTAGVFADGGGIQTSSGTVTLTGSTISGNRASGTDSDGGGVWFDDSVVTMVNSTITGNSATRDGGGLGMSVDAFDKKLTVHNSIIAGNTAGLNPDFTAPTTPATNLEVRFSLIGNNQGTSLTLPAANGNLIGTTGAPIDPKLGPLALNGGPTLTHALLEGSLALDAGDQTLLPVGMTTDQRGVTRIIDLPNVANPATKTGLDIGAVEMAGVTLRLNNPTIAEAAGASTITVSLSTASSFPVTIELAFTGTAKLTSDYTRTGNQIVIPAGQTSGSVTVTAVQDTLIESDESIIVDISGVTNATEATSQQVTITITDDDDNDDGALDFGDAPPAYPVTLAQDGARHTVGPLFLGETMDAETDGTPSANADSDAGDDGVLSLATLVSTNIATTSGLSLIASQPGKLDGWIDFNGDNDWLDAGEQIFTSTNVVAGINVLGFTVPAGAKNGSTAARFRISTAGALAPTGPAANGEVEDYSMTIVNGSSTTNLEVAAPSGETELSIEGSDIAIRKGDVVISKAPLTSIGEVNLNGDTSDDVFKLSLAPSLAGKKLLFDGGSGKDRIELSASSETINLTNTTTTVRNIETIDVRGTGANTLITSVASVKAISSTSDTVEVVSDNDDTIVFGDGWQAELPQIINGQFTHILSEAAQGGTARLEVRNNRFMQNPLNKFDVDRDGFIRALDALQIINAIRRRGNGPFTLPTTVGQISRFYFDVTGTNDLSPLEALLVINAIRRRVPGTGESPIADASTSPSVVDLAQDPAADSVLVIDNLPRLQQTLSSLVETRSAIANKPPSNSVDSVASIARQPFVGKSTTLAQPSRPQTAVEFEAADEWFAEFGQEDGVESQSGKFKQV